MESNPVNSESNLIAQRCPFEYFWLAHFQDGTDIAQFDDNGDEVLYREVLSKLETGAILDYISWVPIHSGSILYTQYYAPWQRPIVLRRHTINLANEEQPVRFILGWQATIDGKNYKTIFVIDPATGTVEIRS